MAQAEATQGTGYRIKIGDWVRTRQTLGRVVAVGDHGVTLEDGTPDQPFGVDYSDIVSVLDGDGSRYDTLAQWWARGK